jgi:6-pyruvoyltetrahydropterin/6-carboxytetrahydropterin synthase
MSNSTMEITVEASFDAAHHLITVPDGHPCGRMHGHRWRVALTLGGHLPLRGPMLVDFTRAKKMLQGLVAPLDHQNLSKLNQQKMGMEDTTAECLAVWIARKIREEMRENISVFGGISVTKVEIWETPNNKVTFTL